MSRQGNSSAGLGKAEEKILNDTEASANRLLQLSNVLDKGKGKAPVSKKASKEASKNTSKETSKEASNDDSELERVTSELKEVIEERRMEKPAKASSSQGRRLMSDKTIRLLHKVDNLIKHDLNPLDLATHNSANVEGRPDKPGESLPELVRELAAMVLQDCLDQRLVRKASDAGKYKSGPSQFSIADAIAETGDRKGD